MDETRLEGQLLIAMPKLADPNFDHTVIFLGSHSPSGGAFGLVVNRPAGIEFSDVLTQLGLSRDRGVPAPEILFGGPVQPDHGFLLMDNPDPVMGEDDLSAGGFFISGRTDLLQFLLEEDQRRPFHLCLGYSGWAAGQLEFELAENAWLVAPSSREILFEIPPNQRWEAALEAIGVNPGALVELGSSKPS